MSPATRPFRFRALLMATSFLAVAGTASAEVLEATTDGKEVIKEVVIQGKRAAKTTAGATGLNLTLRETPQSVTVVSQEQMRDFALTDANDLLAQVPGINVEKVETDRTYYNARGFDITNFQVDGVGLPLIWGIQFGDLDTALFDRVETVRGANGMMTGTGNPSATINYIRKRPTKDVQASLSASYGSWDDKRLEADLSGPLNASGSVTGRLVYANEDKDSYLDYYGVNRNVYYGVLSWDITPKLKLTGGYSQQDNLATGVLWGALPLEYADGSLIDYPVSASTSADWTYWDVHDKSTFGELSYGFDNGWLVKGVLTHKTFEEKAKLLYAFGNPDKTTGLGVFAMTGIYPSTYTQDMADIYASGPLHLFGRDHELVVGASSSRSAGIEYEAFYGDYPAYPAVGDWGRLEVAEPVYPDAVLQADTVDRLDRVYAAAHLNLSDSLKAVVGFNAIKLTSTGTSYGADQSRDEDAVSPYAGVVYDLTPQVSFYASYSDIFNPQSEIDFDLHKLAAAHGKSYEAGIKSEWFDKRLYATAAVFKSEQYGLAEYAGTFSDEDHGGEATGKSYYTGVDTFVKGYELEVSGRISDQWQVGGGWTQLTIKGEDDGNVRTYLPRRTLKLSTTYDIPYLRDLKLGAAVRWQDDIFMQDLVVVPQKAYAVLDLMAGVKVSDHVRATLNIKNATDEKYLTSLMWNQSYYAAPRSVSLTLNYTF